MNSGQIEQNNHDYDLLRRGIIVRPDIEEEYSRLREHYVNAGAEELKLAICEPLILECARAKIQLDELNTIAEQTGLIICKPDRPQLQKALPVATEISRLRASLTSMSYKLVHTLCLGAEEDDDGLGDYE